jgi:magnesium chelatase subunit D
VRADQPADRAVPAFPLSAVVGMDDLRTALLLNAVAPDVGGVLVRGEKGTAKSTAVRALAALLPPVAVVEGCRFGCDPAAPDPGCPDGAHAPGAAAATRPSRLVELPVGASEDRLLGALDLERALAEGVRAFEPGLLAAAHRGILYVDEVNLLGDHLVDVLLDAAAMGRAHVEREGVSVSHASRFLLVGTMNPEEGELRPQLLDRFGFAVEVRASREPGQRAEVVRRRLGYDDDPAAFVAAHAAAEEALATRIAEARARLPKVVLDDAILRQIAGVCAAFDVDGMRADLVIARAARANAAWCGRDVVTGEDVRVAARFALPHRRRRDPFDAPGLDEDQLDQALEDSAPPEQPPSDQPPQPDAPSPEVSAETPDDATADGGPDDDGPDDDGPGGGARQQGAGGRPPAATGDGYRVRRLRVDGVGEGQPGRRSRALGPRGRTIGARRPAEGRGGNRAVHLPATLEAAAPRQAGRGRTGPALVLRPGDLRVPVREGRESNLVLFCVDASGSMAAARRMTEVKGAVAALLRDAYQRRDTVGLVTFRGSDAEVALPPTGAVEVARARLDRLPTGGRTPLAAGLLRAHQVLASARRKDPLRRPLLVVVTDGRHTAGADPLPAAGLLARERVPAVVVDCESGPVRLGLAKRLAGALQAEWLPLEQVRADALTSVVRTRTGLGERGVA